MLDKKNKKTSRKQSSERPCSPASNWLFVDFFFGIQHADLPVFFDILSCMAWSDIKITSSLCASVTNRKRTVRSVSGEFTHGLVIKFTVILLTHNMAPCSAPPLEPKVKYLVDE